MRTWCLSILAGVLLLPFGVHAEDGKAVFDTLHCGNCHRVDTGSVNPSLKEIARTYKEKENQLQSYLKGEAESVVNPEKGNRMKRYIEKTKALKDEERKALADFILKHGD